MPKKLRKNTAAMDLRLSTLFPPGSSILLTGGGKEFVERIGTQAVKHVVLGVLQGENIRTQTEPLTRRRISQVCGILIAMFAKGWITIEGFSEKMTDMATADLRALECSEKSVLWPAQWTIGLTGKLADNVMRGDEAAERAYLADFHAAVVDSANKCRASVGDLTMQLGFVSNGQTTRALGGEDITRLSTALGCAALTIRGSDKSIYGKLFERLVLGSVLTTLGFSYQMEGTAQKRRFFRLSSRESSDRECDATAVVEPGKVARFDMGFIGSGNPEIAKDKLSRYARKFEESGRTIGSCTFVIVDRLPKKGSTEAAAAAIGTELTQMSFKYWPKELAVKLKRNFDDFDHPLLHLPDDQIGAYLAKSMETINIESFVAGIRAEDLPEPVEESEGSTGGVGPA